MTSRSTENVQETLACLIIDDPLLKPKYGCLDFENLLEEMKDHNFFTEIAFIPWNYKRSDPRTVRLISDNADYYSICVHGCNHTNNEFGVGGFQEMSALSSIALWRMEEHQRLTGLVYDPVIVFPQGRFSTLAVKAIKYQGYLAAFNSTIQATDAEKPSAFEFQQPATLQYHNFPIFLRRYPKDKLYFKQDMAFGRPIIIVEHHSAFKNGYKEITDLIDWINNLGNVKWTSLLHIVEHYYGKKPDKIQPRAFTQQHARTNIKIAIRRLLSEFRDNHIETSTLLTLIYKLVRR